MRVLVVDDNPANLEICLEILEDGFDVVTAQSGVEAIQIASESSPQVIVLDVMMLGIDGFETCRRLRQMLSMRDVRIIMVSAKAMPAERIQGLAAGADAYLSKPFDESELFAAINSIESAGLGSDR